jgi:hypothetical protein
VDWHFAGVSVSIGCFEALAVGDNANVARSTSLMAPSSFVKKFPAFGVSTARCSVTAGGGQGRRHRDLVLAKSQARTKALCAADGIVS